MIFRMDHMNINTVNLERSLQFYKEAFDLEEIRRKEAADGSFTLVFLTDQPKSFVLEITWLQDRSEPYNLEDNEIHLCFRTDDYEAALKRHRDMDVIAMENEDMGVYFVEDPDGYWIEVTPERQ